MAPSNVDAVVAFFVVVVPGFLLSRGYVRARTRTEPQPGLQTLTEAIAGSVVVLLIAWPVGAPDLLRWAGDRTLLTDHSDALGWFLLVTLLLAYPIGFGLGATLEYLIGREDSFVVRRLGDTWLGTRLLDPPTVWDRFGRELLADAGQGSERHVRVRTKSGAEIQGVFDDERARVGMAPAPRGLLLSRSDPSGERIAGEGGVFIAGEEIEAVESKPPDEEFLGWDMEVHQVGGEQVQ
jgi:hypothetical protein